MRLVSGVKDDGSLGDWVSVVITAGNVVLNQGNFWAHTADFDLVWGPEKSRFAVIRSVYEQTDRYMAYDLRTGRHLRDERWNEWKRVQELTRAHPFTYRMPFVAEP